MSEPAFQMTREELETLFNHFREFKHNLNNTLAVIMALSELAQRNPVHYEKLAKTVLQRGPDIVQQINEMQAMLGEKLKPSGDGAD